MNLETVTRKELEVISISEDSLPVNRHLSLDLASRWIQSRLAATSDDVNRALKEYQFNEAAGSIYQFIWHEFCDWYIEMAKSEIEDPQSKRNVLLCLINTLDASLRLLHPFMPYVTEEIWQTIKQVSSQQSAVSRQKDSIMVSDYPKSLLKDDKAEEDMSYIIEAVTGIRTIRGELNISPALKLNVSIKTFSNASEKILKENVKYIKRLARAEYIEIGKNVGKPADSATSVKSSIEIYVPLKGVLNIEIEMNRLKKDEAEVDESIAFLNKKLLNDDFMQRAPAEVVKKEKARYEEMMHRKERILKSIAMIKEVGGEK